jgi:hypothetical protein
LNVKRRKAAMSRSRKRLVATMTMPSKRSMLCLGKHVGMGSSAALLGLGDDIDEGVTGIGLPESTDGLARAYRPYPTWTKAPSRTSLRSSRPTTS